MFLRNAWYCAALSHEITQEPKGRIFLNEPVVMYRTQDGTLVALDDRCCHRRVPLSKGQTVGDNLRCMYRGFLFEPSGKLIWVPGDAKIPADAGQRSYPIHEKHGWAWIWMGDPELADPAKVPTFHWDDAPGWAAFGDCMDMEADYLMMVDNLLDLSH
ncbi:MAG: Rieske 2Fe-2S domain-containing protein, partial [Rhodospirillales bacterium]|nr:Rieske 2Fe-2S domain-containing protein [Rhodospirillales bacterium]